MSKIIISRAGVTFAAVPRGERRRGLLRFARVVAVVYAGLVVAQTVALFALDRLL
jgi:hypothetical protein